MVGISEPGTTQLPFRRRPGRLRFGCSRAQALCYRWCRSEPRDVKRGRLGNRCDAPAAGSSPSKPRPACALRRRLDGREACFVVNMSAVERGHEHGAIKDRALVPPQMYCCSTVLPLMSLAHRGRYQAYKPGRPRAGRVLTEAACHDTTGRAFAHDDDAEGCLRGFLARPEIHGYDI
jgi:hypothetical protein